MDQDHSASAAQARRGSARGRRQAAEQAAAFPALPGELTIYTASEVHQSWLAWWGAQAAQQHDAALAVDAHAVESVDGAGLQLLLALARSLHQQGRALELVQPSAALSTACRSLGIADLLPTGEPT